MTLFTRLSTIFIYKATNKPIHASSKMLAKIGIYIYNLPWQLLDPYYLYLIWSSGLGTVLEDDKLNFDRTFQVSFPTATWWDALAIPYIVWN